MKQIRIKLLCMLSFFAFIFMSINVYSQANDRLLRESQRNVERDFKFIPSWPVGMPGAGGGTIAFYDKDNKYDFDFLEMAPENWYDDSGEYPRLPWHPWSCLDELNLCEDIGCGLSNSRQILQHCNSADIEAIRAALSYNGNGKVDWFLPSVNEVKAIGENVGTSIKYPIIISRDYIHRDYITSNCSDNIGVDTKFGSGFSRESVETIGINTQGFGSRGLRISVLKDGSPLTFWKHTFPVRQSNWTELIAYWNTLSLSSDQQKALFDEAMDRFYNKYEDSDHILIMLTKASSVQARVQFAISLDFWGDQFYKNYASQIVERELNRLLLLASEGDADAQFLLGHIYCHRDLGPYQPKDGVNWYQKAADQNHQHAMAYLAYVFDSGLYGVEKNVNKARYWAEKASEHNNSTAFSMLGRITNNTSMIQKASDIGHPIATYRLAEGLLNRTTNVEENTAKAVEYLIKAAEKMHQPAIDKLHELGYRYIDTDYEYYEWVLNPNDPFEGLFDGLGREILEDHKKRLNQNQD